MDINITIPETEIKAVVLEHVKQQLPHANITDIVFTTTRNPVTVKAEVIADFKGGTSSTIVTAQLEEPVKTDEPVVVEEKEDETPTEEPVEEDTKPVSKKSLFSKKPPVEEGEDA